MRCLICCRDDAREINLELLQRISSGPGTVARMAKRLGVHRATLWRHRKLHLKMYMKRGLANIADLSFEERARLLGTEAARIQVQAENGAPHVLVKELLEALTLRMKSLEMEAKFAGRALKRQAPVTEDFEEEERARREFAEVVGEQ